MNATVHYVACWTEDAGIVSCGHEHESIAEALECLIPDGRTFLRVRDNGILRSLNDDEFHVFVLELSRRHAFQ